MIKTVDAAAMCQQSAAAGLSKAGLRSRSVSTSLSPFAVSAALQPLSCDLDNSLASPFLSMQRASLTQVWRDWASMQPGGAAAGSSSTSSGSTATGVCGLQALVAAAAAAAGDVSCVGQKRRMVTTESPGMGSAANLSAPAKLQRGQDGSGAAVRVAVQQRWVAAAAAAASRLALKVEA